MPSLDIINEKIVVEGKHVDTLHVGITGTSDTSKDWRIWYMPFMANKRDYKITLRSYNLSKSQALTGANMLIEALKTINQTSVANFIITETKIHAD